MTISVFLRSVLGRQIDFDEGDHNFQALADGVNGLLAIGASVKSEGAIAGADSSAAFSAANALGIPINCEGGPYKVVGVTITSPIVDTLNQIFTTDSTVTLNNGLPVRPEWFGNGQGNINLAVNALPAAGGTVTLRYAVYPPQNHGYGVGAALGTCWGKAHVKIVGEKMPMLATDCKSLTGGTIIQGRICVYADDFEIVNVGVDCGFTVCATYNAGSDAAPWNEGLAFTYPDDTTKNAVTYKRGLRTHNVIGLAYGPATLGHAVILAEGYQHVVSTGQVVGCYGVHGVVIKAEDVKAEIITAYCNNWDGLIIKSDSPASAVASKVRIGLVNAVASGPVGLAPYAVATGNTGVGCLLLTGPALNIDAVQIDRIASLGYAIGVGDNLGTGGSLTRVQIGEVNADCIGTTVASAGFNLSGMSGNLIDQIHIGSLVVANATKGLQALYYGSGQIVVGAINATNITDVIVNTNWQATLSIGQISSSNCGGCFRIGGSAVVMLGSYITDVISPSGGSLFVSTLDDAGLAGLVPAFSNGWTQYAGNDTFGVQLNGGRVSLQGLIKPGTTATAAALPFWATPKQHKRFMVQGYNGTTVVSVPVTVDTSGNVNVNEIGGGTSNCSTWLSLSGVNYTLLD